MRVPALGLVLVGAGSSRRMAGIDKVWADLGGQPILWYALTRLAPRAQATVLVVRADQVGIAREFTGAFPGVQVVAGGRERRDSVALGLEALPPVEVVAIHDVARPLAGPAFLERGLGALDGVAGAIPAIRVTDTIKEIGPDGIVRRTVDREHLRAVQTPQLFRFPLLRDTHRDPALSRLIATDDAALLEAAGRRVRVFDGDPRNIKITTAADLALARVLLAQEM